MQVSLTELVKLSNHWHFTSNTQLTCPHHVSAQSNFICPERDGYFEDATQCDKYYDCYDGVPEERLCPDGLVFDPFSRKREPCDHYFNVDCGDRLDLRKCSGSHSIFQIIFYLHPRASKGSQWSLSSSEWFLLSPRPCRVSHLLLVCWWPGWGVHLLLWTLVWRVQRSVQLGRADWQTGLQGWGLW